MTVSDDSKAQVGVWDHLSKQELGKGVVDSQHCSQPSIVTTEPDQGHSGPTAAIDPICIPELMSSPTTLKPVAS